MPFIIGNIEVRWAFGFDVFFVLQSANVFHCIKYIVIISIFSFFALLRIYMLSKPSLFLLGL